ncbi:cytochrome c oxidase assembly protein [Amaricoccus sp. W119]|uniref:cytochrome c oxidase assembly protein n=1 Tax=Amaricoccus sp. W119 TaxID=3391833 RepID=UPI0039A5238A
MKRNPNANLRVALGLAAVIPAMVGLSFAAVPLYNWFCRTTGYGGTTSVADQAPDEVLEREITVTFDANLAKGMPWEFRPTQREMKIRIGESGLAFFEAYNPTDEVTAGQAGYNVTPDSAGRFFDKVDCFCFNLQVLKPGERVEMPVSFFVDPELVKDSEATYIKAITLSYTMFSIEVPEEYRSAGDDQAEAADASPATELAAGPSAAPDQTLEQ